MTVSTFWFNFSHLKIGGGEREPGKRKRTSLYNSLYLLVFVDVRKRFIINMFSFV
jgi:hypothetical protein